MKEAPTPRRACDVMMGEMPNRASNNHQSIKSDAMMVQMTANTLGVTRLICKNKAEPERIRISTGAGGSVLRP
jgi:hypothetical protein